MSSVVLRTKMYFEHKDTKKKWDVTKLASIMRLKLFIPTILFVTPYVFTKKSTVTVSKPRAWLGLVAALSLLGIAIFNRVSKINHVNFMENPFLLLSFFRFLSTASCALIFAISIKINHDKMVIILQQMREMDELFNANKKTKKRIFYKAVFKDVSGLFAITYLFYVMIANCNDKWDVFDVCCLIITFLIPSASVNIFMDLIHVLHFYNHAIKNELQRMISKYGFGGTKVAPM